MFGIFLSALLALPAAPARAQYDRELVRVNGTPIRQSEVVQRLLERYGDQTLDEMIDELLLRQEAQREHIKVTQAEIDRRLARMKSKFSDPKLFEAQLEQYGSSIDKLKQEIGEQISREKVVLAHRKINVSAEDLRQTFALHKDELGQPEAVHVEHMLVRTRADADAVAKAVTAGADFAQLAREKSLVPSERDGQSDYGWVVKGMLPPELEDAAFAAKAGSVKIVPSSKGFHVIHVIAHRPAVAARFSQVKEDLRRMLLEEKIKRALPGVVRDLREKAQIVPQGQ